MAFITKFSKFKNVQSAKSSQMMDTARLHAFTDPLVLKSTFTTNTVTTAYKLPDLPYGYNELEPIVSAEIMELHHKKHHATYVNNLNAALEKYSGAQAKNDVATMISLQGAIKFNGGGHVNHSIFWTNLAPTKKRRR